MPQVLSSAEQNLSYNFATLHPRQNREITNSGNFRGYLTYSRGTLETITTIALWRHYSGGWDNAASIAAHNNAASK